MSKLGWARSILGYLMCQPRSQAALCRSGALHCDNGAKVFKRSRPNIKCILHGSAGSLLTLRRSPYNAGVASTANHQQRHPGSLRQQTFRCRSTSESDTEGGAAPSTAGSDPEIIVRPPELDKEVSKFVRNAATTFAPRASGPSKNPAYPGSTLYKVFEWQAWISVVIGGLLSYNIIYPSDKPDIARLLGMWTLWIFTVPSLRARDCSAAEKDALNLLFIGLPLLNITLPLIWKSFPFIYTTDVVALFAIYAWKVWLPAGKEQKQE